MKWLSRIKQWICSSESKKKVVHCTGCGRTIPESQVEYFSNYIPMCRQCKSMHEKNHNVKIYKLESYHV